MNNNQTYENFEVIDESTLVVVDFSAVVNADSSDEFECFTKYLCSKKVKVAVGREFYENLEIIDENGGYSQKFIKRRAVFFLNALKKANCLFYMSDFISADKTVKKLASNPRICLVYYKYSDFSENVVCCSEMIKCKAVVIDENGCLNLYSNGRKIVEASRRGINLSVIDDCYFSVSSVPESGSVIMFGNGKAAELGELLGTGAEGNVYRCSSMHGYAVKIYHKGQLNKLRLKKLLAMETKKVEFDGVCWPEMIAYNKRNEPVGYIMKEAHGVSLDRILDGAETADRMLRGFTRKDYVKLACEVLKKIQYLHMHGIIIGDLRLKNIVSDEKGRVSFVDMDSCQIEDLTCPTGFNDYTPPELQEVEFRKTARTYYNESFACAVIMFKILFYGIHPYDRTFGAETIEEEIRCRNFPYPVGNDTDFRGVPWGEYESVWRETPVQIQNFLYDIFRNGERYSVQEMIIMLKAYTAFLEKETVYGDRTYKYA